MGTMSLAGKGFWRRAVTPVDDHRAGACGEVGDSRGLVGVDEGPEQEVGRRRVSLEIGDLAPLRAGQPGVEDGGRARASARSSRRPRSLEGDIDGIGPLFGIGVAAEHLEDLDRPDRSGSVSGARRQSPSTLSVVCTAGVVSPQPPTGRERRHVGHGGQRVLGSTKVASTIRPVFLSSSR